MIQQCSHLASLQESDHIFEINADQPFKITSMLESDGKSGTNMTL